MMAINQLFLIFWKIEIKVALFFQLKQQYSIQGYQWYHMYRFSKRNRGQWICKALEGHNWLRLSAPSVGLEFVCAARTAWHQGLCNFLQPKWRWGLSSTPRLWRRFFWFVEMFLVFLIVRIHRWWRWRWRRQLCLECREQNRANRWTLIWEVRLRSRTWFWGWQLDLYYTWCDVANILLLCRDVSYLPMV